MLDSIEGFSPAETDIMIYKNLIEQIRYYKRSPGSILVEDKRIIKFKTVIPLPFFNCVLFYDLDKGSLVKELRKFKEYGQKKQTSLLWLKGPFSNPSDIGSILAREGFAYDDRMKGMAIDIDRLNRNSRDIPGFRIEAVSNTRQLCQWVYTCLKGFDEKVDNFSSIYSFEEDLGLGTALPWVRFTGFIDERPVATSAVFMGSQTAGLDNVTTIPQYRKKGIGALMVEHALMFSRTRGYGVGVLQASDMGLSLYRHLGFREFADTWEFIWKVDKNNKG